MAFARVTELTGHTSPVTLDTIFTHVAPAFADTNALLAVLFGSYAYGTPNEHSDLDILVVADTKVPQLSDYRVVYDAWAPWWRGIDMLVFTPKQTERLRKFSPFHQRIFDNGIVLYERT